MQVLLVEDDPSLGRSLQKGLRESGALCNWSSDGLTGHDEAMTQWADVIVLDLLLPDLPGLELLKQIRSEGLRTPVLILSAQGSVDERVTGLQHGADDYMVKPFAFAELLARLQALTRRKMEVPPQRHQAGPLSLDLTVRRVTREGKEIDLTPTEFSVLEFLMRHQGQVVTRRMLCEHLWQADWEGVTNVVEVHVSRLRAKIDRGFNGPLLQTIRGRGYRLKSTGESSSPG